MVLCLGVVGLFFFLAPLLGENGLPAYFRLRSQRNRLRDEVRNLQQHQDQLQQEIEDLQNDPAALERLARERFNMHRPEEQTIEIVSPPGQRSP